MFSIPWNVFFFPFTGRKFYGVQRKLVFKKIKKKSLKTNPLLSPGSTPAFVFRFFGGAGALCKTVIRLKYQNRHLKTSFNYSILNIDSKPRYIYLQSESEFDLIWLQLGASGRVKWEVIDGEERCHNRGNALPQYQLVARIVLKANQPSFVLYCCKN